MNRFERVQSLLKGVRVADQWWQERFADMVERRNKDGTYTPKMKRAMPAQVKSADIAPPPLERPADMPRQMHRRLYRQAVKTAGMRRPQAR